MNQQQAYDQKPQLSEPSRGSQGAMSHRAANLHVTARSAAITALAGTALCAGCGTGGSPDTSGSGPGTNAPVAGAIQAQYRLTIGDDGEWYTLYEVITAADQGARVELTVPVDDPVTVYRWVWDGRRVLEAGDEADDMSYTLYEAPEEEEGLLDFIKGWVLDPEGDEFASRCLDAESIDETKKIAGRPARGFRCRTETDEETLWVDEETDLLLSQSGITSEADEPFTLEAERVTLDVPTDDRTFSTEAPKGADVEVVKATGTTPQPPGEPKSAAELESILRDIAATTDSRAPIYYVGREFDGEPLSDVVIYKSKRR